MIILFIKNSFIVFPNSQGLGIKLLDFPLWDEADSKKMACGISLKLQKRRSMCPVLTSISIFLPLGLCISRSIRKPKMCSLVLVWMNSQIQQIDFVLLQQIPSSRSGDDDIMRFLRFNYSTLNIVFLFIKFYFLISGFWKILSYCFFIY